MSEQRGKPDISVSLQIACKLTYGACLFFDRMVLLSCPKVIIYFRPSFLFPFIFSSHFIRFLINISTCLKATLRVRSAYDGDKRKYRFRLVEYIFPASDFIHCDFIREEVILI